MPAKHKLVQVTIKRARNVDEYVKKYGGNKYGKDMKELLAGVAAMKNWTLTIDKQDKVTGAYPKVDKHVSHGQGKEWKLNVETGNASQDRLWVKVVEIKTEPNKREPGVTNVKVTATVSVDEDTHKRDSRK